MGCKKEIEDKGKYTIEQMMDDVENGIIRCQTCGRGTKNPRGEEGSAAESFFKTYNYSKGTIGFYKVGMLGKIPFYACQVCADAGIWPISEKEKENSMVVEVKLS
jgi:hypothetical protein